MNNSAKSAREQQLDEIVTAYLKDVDAGRPPDRQALLARHPELAEDLAAFFAAEKQVEKLAGPNVGITDAPTLTQSNQAPAAPAGPLPGVRVGYFGDYELLSELGRGGMGVVYKARQVSLNRVVALKMILTGQLANADDVKRFQIEAEAAAKLDHPGIVPVFEVGKYEGHHYYSMAYIEGESLARQVAQRLPSPRAAAELTRKVAEAVAYAHLEGVVHRDLKPANILIDAHGQPRLTDFGLAKQVRTEPGDAARSELTASGQILGTPSYMAPEQASGRRQSVGPLADVYSLGAILYSLLTGRPPFQADNPLDTLLQVLEQEPVSPRQLNSAVPLDLETISLKCLQKEPAKRYATARHLVEDLDRHLRGEPIIARPVGPIERLVRWRRRQPALAAAVFGAFLILVVGVIVSSFFAVKAANEALRARAAAEAESRARVDAEEQRQRAQELAEQEKQARKTAIAEKERADQQLQVAELRFYAGQLAMAERAWEEHKPAKIREILDDCQWDLRDVEHRLLWTLSRAEPRAFAGHTGPVHCLALSPKRQLLASGSSDRTIRVWDARTGDAIRKLDVPAVRVLSLAFSPDGKHLVSSHGDPQKLGGSSEIKLWDIDTGKELTSLGGQSGHVVCVAFSPDGRKIVGGSGGNDAQGKLIPGSIKVWDKDTGRELISMSGSLGWVTGVAFSPDGQRIVSGGAPSSVQVWDAATGKEILSLKGHTVPASCVAFSADGQRIVSGSMDSTLKVWDATSGQLLRSFKGPTLGVSCVSFTPDGRRVSSGSGDGTIKIWDVEQGQQLLSLQAHTTPVTSLILSPDGKQLFTSSGDGGRVDKAGEIKAWEIAGPQVVLTLKGHTYPAACVAISPDGRRIVSGSRDNTIRVWDAVKGQEILFIKEPAGMITSISFSPDGQRFASSSYDPNKPGNLKIWDAATGKVLAVLSGHTAGVWSAVISPDGRQIASAGLDGTMRLWDLPSGHERACVKGLAPRACYVAFSPDSKRVASSGWLNEVKVFDAANGSELLVLKGHKKPAMAVAFSPDGRSIIAGGEDGTILVWDAVTGKSLRTLSGKKNMIFSVAFSSDGKMLAAGGGDPSKQMAMGDLLLWDFEQGTVRSSYPESIALVTCVSISPDARSVVASTSDGSLKVWRMGSN